MAELVNCPCGEPPNVAVFGDAIVVDHCDVSVAGVTEEDVVRRWNGLMRPRPVTRWEWRSGTYAQYLSCGHVDLGYVMWKRGCVHPWVAYCAVTDEESGPMMLEDARAWLADCARDSGFDVREE